MLKLAVSVSPARRERIVDALVATEGVHRVTVQPMEGEDGLVVGADVEPMAADEAVLIAKRHSLYADGYQLWRVDTVAPAARTLAALSSSAEVGWVEILGRAVSNSRAIWRFVVLMVCAGLIAGVGVLGDSPILVIGAMAISPDLLPLCAASVGIAGRKWTLSLISLRTLMAGLAAVAGASAAVSFGAYELGLLDGGFELHPDDLGGLTSPGIATVVIAAAAGVAGILTFETRASAAVGVAISITTIPASAYFGVAVITERPGEFAALAVLFLNIAVVLVAGTTTLLIQRWRRSRNRQAALRQSA